MIEETTTIEIEKPKVVFRILDNSKRSRNSMVLLWLVIGITMISAVSDYAQLLLLQRIEEGVYIEDSVLTLNDVRQSILGILQVILNITFAIVFLFWFRRAYENLGRIKVNTAYNSQWTIWGWIVPIMNLFRPVQMMNEIWDRTQEKLKTFDGQNNIVRDGLLIGSWWTLHIINSFISRYVMKTAFKEDTLEQLIETTKAYIISDLLVIPEGLLLVFIIHRISKMETRLAEQVKENGGMVLSRE
jgi:hypothetical protein